MAFVSDSFTDSDGTNLESHTGETGASWTNHPSYSASAKIQTNRVHSNSDLRCVYASGTPASADYDVEAVIRKVTATGNSAICGRVNTSANTMYLVMFNSSGWLLYKLVSGTSTQLGSTYADTPATGTDRTVKLSMSGTAIKVYVDGTERISVTDSSITAAGRAAVRLSGGSSTTAFHIDSISATEAGGTVTGSAALSGTGTLATAGVRTVTGDAQLSGSGTLASAGSRVVVGGAALSGSGTLASTGMRTTFAGATLSGSGALVASGVRTTFAGVGLIDSYPGDDTYPGDDVYPGSPTILGYGTLSAAGVRTTSAGAALSGLGTLASTGKRTAVTGSALSGSGTLASTGKRTASMGAALSGAGSLSATGVRKSFAGAALSGTGTLATAGIRTTLATAALTGSGTLDGSGHRDVAAQAALSGSGTLAATPSGMSAYSDAVVNDGATTYLRLGETSGTTAADAVGSNAHTYQGSPTLGATSLLGGDSANKAVTLNGSSQYVSNGSPGSALDVGDTFTVECWLKRGGTGTQQDIWGRDYGGGQIIRISSGNAIVLRKSGIANIVTSTTTITDTSTAHHIVVTKSGSTVKIYIDGADVTGSVSNQTFGSVSGASVIARDAASSSGYLNGTLDEFAVYKNVALTSTQVADHYDLGTRIRGAAALSGTGTLTATASTAGTQTGAAALSGTGDLTSAGTVTRLGGAALSGSGALAGAGTRTTSGGAGLTGSGTLATAGIRTRSSDAALSGSGTLATAGVRTASGDAQLSGSGTLATAGTVTPGATYGAALTGTGLLATAGVRTRFGEVTLFGTGTLAATGFQGLDGSASLAGTGVLGADGYATVSTGAGLVGSGVLASAVAGKIARLAVSTSAIDVGLADESIDVGLGSSESARVTVGVS